MTKKQIFDFIESLNREPGDYSQDELFTIGTWYKQIPRPERRWEELLAALGISQSARNFTQWIYDKTKSQKIDLIATDIPKLNAGYTGFDGSLETSKEDLENTITTKLQNLYVERVKTQDVYAQYKKTLRDEARIEALKSAIKETVAQLQELPKSVYNPANSNNKNNLNEGILLLSDFHIGVDCDNFYNTYNINIAKKRIDKVVADTIKYCKLYNVLRLNVCNLGDLIHGIIHINARIGQEFDVVSQIMIAAELLSEAINKLQEAAPEVIYRSVVDNHSRAVANKEEHIEKENFNKLIDWFIKERLQNTSVIFADDNIDDGIGKFNLLNKKLVVMAHGHQDSKNSAFQNYVGALREYVDYICIGHYHSAAVKSFQGCQVFINGSLVGTEQYALNNRLFSQPCQKLIIFEGENIVDIDIITNINK